jgi:hypothetical protein
MDRHVPVEAEELIRRMRAEFEQTMRQVAQAVSDAPDGHWIDASEEQARDALGEFKRKVYEQAVQMKVESAETLADFPPSPAVTGASRDGGSIPVDRQRPYPGATATL